MRSHKKHRDVACDGFCLECVDCESNSDC
jgi:hypothetical protein